ncbi:uncharacterized protein LOC133669478 isoform X2 [Populus nigra]|uniref:uncharacterized protein LOC133669478 isoform X2 n=1 Tax=Populus nigra TaxID=3691 RepID=UPI002B26DA82|nr:uncharacterized protein LOC133669478 isoform X2 [Populus nigra]
MGGCASVPKDLKDEVGSAPAPEPPMEETAENNEAVKVELEAVEKVEEENAEKSDDYKKSLGSLLNEMETTSESKEEEVPCKQNEEQAATEAPAAESEKEQIKNAEGEKKEDN